LALQVKKETKQSNRTVEELFTAAIDQFLIDVAKEKDVPGKKRKAHNPSSYYKCQRMKWYELMDFSANKKIVARNERIFAVGTATHEWIQNDVFMKMDEREGSTVRLIPREELPVFGKEGIEFITEHKAPPMEIKFLDWRFTKLFPISAMIDGALRFASTDMLFEFKTIKSSDFGMLIEPSADYRKQGAIYATSLGVSKVMFLFINKDTQEFKAYLVEYGQAQYDWVVDRITTLEGYVERNELPPKEVSDNCRWCSFKGACDKELSEKPAK
jgi:CRISPR/Cas system-associated exonuclease Cas4 (RecB family)